jgi:hypothetical protein
LLSATRLHSAAKAGLAANSSAANIHFIVFMSDSFPVSFFSALAFVAQQQCRLCPVKETGTEITYDSCRSGMNKDPAWTV